MADERDRLPNRTLAVWQMGPCIRIGKNDRYDGISLNNENVGPDWFETDVEDLMVHYSGGGYWICGNCFDETAHQCIDY